MVRGHKPHPDTLSYGDKCLQARLVKTVNIRVRAQARVHGQDRRFNQWVTAVSDRYRLGHRSVVHTHGARGWSAYEYGWLNVQSGHYKPVSIRTLKGRIQGVRTLVGLIGMRQVVHAHKGGRQELKRFHQEGVWSVGGFRHLTYNGWNGF